MASTALVSGVEVRNQDVVGRGCLLIVCLLVAGLLRYLWRGLHGLVQLEIWSFALSEGDGLVSKPLILLLFLDLELSMFKLNLLPIVQKIIISCAWLWLLVRRMLWKSSLVRLDILDDLFVNRLV